MLDTYFKQHFWTFRLGALFVSAFLSARTINAFVEQSLSPPASAVAQTTPVATDQIERPKQQTLIPISAFLERNVFRAAREDLTPPPPEEKPQDDGNVDLNNCEKSPLALNLVATMVAHNEASSIAVFGDASKQEPSAVRLGEKVLGEAEVVSIDWRRVLVKHNGRCEFFSLEEEKPAITGGGPAAPPPAVAQGDGAPPSVELGKGITKTSESEWRIPKSEIENILGNFNALATQARIVPSFNNGKANGFKLFSIRPDSLYSKIGVQNGDIVQKINGYEINSPDKALEIYSKLKDAQSITVDLIRRGRTQTLSYAIQ